MDPKVGIFFFIDNEILTDAVPVSEAEPYGDALQHGGHYEFWESLVPKTGTEKKLKARAYDAYPRGRVVFFPAEEMFRVYMDKCLTAGTLEVIREKFGLMGSIQVELKGDEHYRCAGCNPNYMD